MDATKRPAAPSMPSTGPVDGQYDENGVDRTLVRYTLSMTPVERLKTHDRLLGDIERLEHAGRAARDGRT